MPRLSIQFNRLCTVLAMCIVFSGCRKGDDATADAFGTSLLFDNATPDAREALATPVNFRITEDNYAQWERAQQFLDALPKSALPTSVGEGRSPIDRAVGRLESSPQARTAIERTGLSVRDFVLLTIALAQATDAGAGGKLVSASPVAAENFRFVQRYGSRILRSRAQGVVARRQSEEYYLQSDTATKAEDATMMDVGVGVEPEEQKLDSTATGERAEHDLQKRNDTLPAREPARDTVRDSLSARQARLLRVPQYVVKKPHAVADVLYR